MADKKVDKVEEAPKSALAAEWDKFLAHYQSKNPKKYAEKLARGEFKEPSVEFVESVANGSWAKNKAKLGIK
jgi:hypothetical protein